MYDRKRILELARESLYELGLRDWKLAAPPVIAPDSKQFTLNYFTDRGPLTLLVIIEQRATEEETYSAIKEQIKAKLTPAKAS